MFYFIKTPWWLKKLFSAYVWHIETKEKILYLTFDDGPDPKVTSFVLDELKNYNAKATFFCIGKNVVAHPEIYRRILDEGHAVGNHTHNHLNGWKTKDETYLKNISEAAQYIDSGLFRPPYGKITSFQAKHLAAAIKKSKPEIIMWDVLSGDFDEKITPEDCLQNVILNVKQGSIVVFHDSEKAFPLMSHTLPKILEYYNKKRYRFDKLTIKKSE
ncbi:MAG: polysaccharide deacetylase family protein [Bacteroidota bacterium]|nr:polysaccharide deacetylase family protein [Bacteroidota bacterium]